MHRDSRIRRPAATPCASQLYQTASMTPGDETSQLYIYPTPTSLESRASPVKAPLVQVFPTLGSVFEQPSSQRLEHKDEEVLGCLPLVVGPTPRQTGVISMPKRAKRRRKAESLGMDRARGEARRSSFSQEAHHQLLVDSHASIKECAIVTTPPATCQLALSSFSNRTLGAALNDCVLMRRLVAQLRCDRIGGVEDFSRVRVGVATQNELANSLCTLFYPVCHKYGASLDTAFLAYGILCKYSQRCAPRLASTRSQLYIAALLIAFKYNEEEDPNISDFARTIAKLPDAPSIFTSQALPTPSAVTRMEQRMMRTIEWKIGDIVTPLVLIMALLDTLPGSWSVSAKHRVLGLAIVVLEGLLATPNAYSHLQYSLSRWTVFASSQVLFALSKNDSCSVDQYVRLLHRIIVPDAHLETESRPSWLEALSKHTTEQVATRSFSLR